MSEPEPDIADTAGPAKPQRRVRHLHGPRFYVRMAVLLGVLLPLVFAGVAGFMMLGREVTAPSWITNRVESNAAAFLGGGSVEFGAITLTVSRDLHPTIALTNAVLRDADAAVIARVPRMDVQISPRGLLLRREILVQKVHLTGAQLALRRAADGSVGLAFETGGALVRQAPTVAGLLDEINSTLERPGLEALVEVSADGVIVNFEDARAQQRWTVDGGTALLDLRGGRTRLRGDLSVLSGRPYVTSMVVNYDSDRAQGGARMGLTVENAVAADLATQVPALNWLAALDAPLSASVRAEILADGTLGRVNAALKIGEGAVQPTPETPPIPFSAAKTYLTYDPRTAEVSFDRVEVDSAWGSLAADGRAFLRDLRNGLPETLIAQLNLTNISLNPDRLFEVPRVFDRAAIDFRLRLDPFQVDVGLFSATDGDQTVRGDGRVQATAAGWDVSVNARADTLSSDWILTNWPRSIRATTRDWFANNLIGATYNNFAFGARFRPDAPPVVAGSLEFADATVRFMNALPPIEGGAGFLSLQDGGMVVALDQGRVTAPQGGALDLAGSVFAIPDIRIRQAPAQVNLAIDGPIEAALSVLDLPPFEYMSKAGLPVDLAQGRTHLTGQINLPLKPMVPPDEIAFDFAATLSDVSSTRLVPGRVLSADNLDVQVGKAGMAISGDMRLDRTAVTGRWSRAFGPDTAGTAVFDGSLAITPQVLADFGVALPEGMVGGRGQGTIAIAFQPDGPARFTFGSDLVGLGLSLPQVSWSKPAEQSGALSLTGVLTQPPTIEALTLEAGTLSLAGDVTLIEGGGFERARFNTARLGGWFDGAVDIVGRGAGTPVGIVVRGGTLDLRQATFGPTSGNSTQGGPITVALDQLQISEGLALAGLRGDFGSAGGFSGNFTAKLNGATALTGTVAPSDGQTAVRIRSDDAGGILRSANLMQNANGGGLELILLPTGATGNYDGQLTMTDLRVRDAPALASLLDAISVVGLLQQMDGQGMAFSNVDARFRLTPEQVIVTSSSAVGPGLGISMDGVYTLASKVMDFQGVVSPLYLINGIGSVLTRQGEGLLGFNYTLGGTADDVRVAVNPLSIFTPGMFREIFRRPPPNPDAAQGQ